jgi:hypothetical protein
MSKFNFDFLKDKITSDFEDYKRRVELCFCEKCGQHAKVILMPEGKIALDTCCEELSAKASAIKYEQ